MPSVQNAGKPPAAQNTDTHPFPPYSTWLSAETLDMHCTVDDHRRHCCRLLIKKSGSPNSTRCARPDSCVRQCWPSTIARLCTQHQHTGKIRRWLYNYMQNRRAKVHLRQQESKSIMLKTEVLQVGVMSLALFNYYLADFPIPPQNIKMIKYADDIIIYTSGQVVADLINGLNIYPSVEHHGVQPTGCMDNEPEPYRPFLARSYPELRTWMVVRSGVISVFPTHSGNAPASPDIRPTTWLCPTCLPSTNYFIYFLLFFIIYLFLLKGLCALRRNSTYK